VFSSETVLGGISQRQKIVAAIYVAGASINEAAEAHHASGRNTAYASWTTP
jgi:hypothetical protein